MSPSSLLPSSSASSPRLPAHPPSFSQLPRTPSPPPGPGSPGQAQTSFPASAASYVPQTPDAGNPLLPHPSWLTHRVLTQTTLSAAATPKSSSWGPEQTGIAGRLGDGLDVGSYQSGGNERVGVLHELMRVRTLLRDDYPMPGERVPGLLEWAVSFPGAFDREFDPEERKELGRMYNPWDPEELRFHDEDIIQRAEERLPCGGCAPRTVLRECGIHGTDSLADCSMRVCCLQAGDTRGGATCLLDNFVRVVNRIVDGLEGRQPALPPARISPELAAALEKVPPGEAAQGITAIIFYTYELKAPPDTPKCIEGSRPTQLYKLQGCAMRSLGDPAASERLTETQRELWRRVVELLRPFHWRLDRILLALPHQPRVVYRGIDRRVSDTYTVGSFVLWPPVTSTSASMEVAWEFMDDEGSGTFFIVLTLSVADIAPFSWLPAEEEWLLHGLSVHQVTDKMRSGLRAILGTNHDLVCLIQVDRRVPRPLPDQMVRARALALRLQTMLFKGFLATYVPPAVAVGSTATGVAGAVGRVPLEQAAREWSASESRTVLLVGEGGSGKTSTSLNLARAAADEHSPLPSPPEYGQPWVPIHITLPVVDNILAPGTGEGHSVRPLTDYIIASNHLSPAEVAEMKKLPLLLVLDGLEEVPEGLSRLRGRGLLAAAGLNLAEWPLAKVVLCIRTEILQEQSGCVHWQLTERDVLPEGTLWYIHEFGPEEVELFKQKVVRREVLSIAKAGALAEPEEAEAALLKSVAALRCAPPPVELARQLQKEARLLHSNGADAAAASELAAVRTAAGHACSEAMLSATASVIARVGAADPTLVSSPFVLSMVVSVGQVLASPGLEGGTRRAVYGAWLAAEVRRRLPRIGELAARCPAFAAMDEHAKVAEVLRFCGALACSSAMIDVIPSLLIVAALRRFTSVAAIRGLGLCTLGEDHLGFLLEAAPLRLESGEGAMLSFPHASVHDFFAADRAALLAAQDGAEQHPDMQRVALVLPRSVSLEEATREVLGSSDDTPLMRLRRRIRVLRIVQGIVLLSMLTWALSYALRDMYWYDRVRTAALAILFAQLFIPRRRRVGQRVKWHYVCAFGAYCAFAVKRAMDLSQCGTSRLDPKWEKYICSMYRLIGVVDSIVGAIPLCIISAEPQFLAAAAGQLNLYEWPSVMHRRATIASTLTLSLHTPMNLMWESFTLLTLFFRIAAALVFAFFTYRLLRLPARVQRH
eukprot:TRINITY_DN14826_c0_g1_i1.p1 TRINITY_DN14826_c0_g1~~TRINITY_DN14826_c0_g1_i1.p1  ORF type:complete len:1349 (+),score=288.56 TRINITY_DN14826_c0_g1_i1:394-4047(+)